MKYNSTEKNCNKFNLFFLIIIILFIISNVSFSQGRRDRISGNINYTRINLSDTTTRTSSDSLITIDTTKLLPVDSTARIKYFKYNPEYTYNTKISRSKSPLLLNNSDQIKKRNSF
ncbi:MAG: hypothetical protein IPJ45_13620 [Ignavibacteria bacterium]|nr:hypothetical protein [Ignavibacteria bacterium]